MKQSTWDRPFLLPVLLIGAAFNLTAAETPATSLLALSKSDQTLAIVDPVTLKVIARMPSGPDPHEVVASADGKYAYISNYGGGAYNTIGVIDLVNQKALDSLNLGALRGPHGLEFTAGKLWFTAEGAKAIASYDPATRNIDWILGTGQNRTHMLHVSADQKQIVTANVASANMSILDKTSRPGRGPGAPAQSDWNQTLVKAGNGAEGFDLSPNGAEIWAANAQDGTVTIIDLAARQVKETLNANVRGANRLKFTPDGKLVFISTLSGPDLTVIDAATHKEVKRIPIGHGAAGIQMQPDGARAFVGCTPDNYVAIIDLKSMTVAGHIDVGKQPDGLAWAVRQ